MIIDPHSYRLLRQLQDDPPANYFPSWSIGGQDLRRFADTPTLLQLCRVVACSMAKTQLKNRWMFWLAATRLAPTYFVTETAKNVEPSTLVPPTSAVCDRSNSMLVSI